MKVGIERYGSCSVSAQGFDNRGLGGKVGAHWRGEGVAFRSSLKYKKGLETRRSRSSRDFRL